MQDSVDCGLVFQDTPHFIWFYVPFFMLDLETGVQPTPSGILCYNVLFSSDLEFMQDAVNCGLVFQNTPDFFWFDVLFFF